MEQHLIVCKYFSISPATVDLLRINFPQIIFFVGKVEQSLKITKPPEQGLDTEMLNSKMTYTVWGYAT